MGKTMTIIYSTVTERYKKVAIVGSGSSLKDVELKFPGDVAVIAVNSAILYLRRVDFWFTLNPSQSNREIMQSRFSGVKYYAAVPDNFKPISDHIHYLKRLEGDGHGKYRTKGGLSGDKNAINTGNSGWGAFQLGVHMDPEYIAIFGIDGMGGYFYGGNPKELSMIPELFESSVENLKERGIKVVNGSPCSTVTCFPRMKPEEAFQWLMDQK